MTHKAIRPEAVEIKDADKGIVTAVISTFGVIDSDGDVTSKATFADGARVLVSAYGHGSWTGAPPIGKGTLRTTDTEAIAELQFNLATQAGRDTFEAVKFSESLQEWSYSLEKTVAHAGEVDGKPANFLDSTVVKEVSPVLRGASVNTHTQSVKADGLKFSEHADAVLTAVDELITRTADVVTKRAEAGKTLGEESRELMGRVDAALVELRKALDEPAPSNDHDPPADIDEATAEWLHMVRAELEGASQ